MDNSQENRPNKLKAYWIYSGIGILYVVVKIVFIAAGYLHSKAVFHGMIPGVLTVMAGLLAMKEMRQSSGEKKTWFTIAKIFAVLVFVTTPLYMYLKERGMWLTNGRLPVLVIYEIFAAMQFFILKSGKRK